MKFREFSKSLSSEIENLFATLGDNCLPEEAHRLDHEFSIQDMLERVKNLDIESDAKSPSDTKPLP
jgi:hypothetical protein